MYSHENTKSTLTDISADFTAGLRLTQTGNKLILTIVEAVVSDQNKKTLYN